MEGCHPKPLETTTGVLDPPLGRVRQAMIELIQAAVQTKIDFVLDTVESSGLLSVLIDFFFQFKWNNFLHQSVFAIFSSMLQSPNEKFVLRILENCHLVDRILQEEAENKTVYEKTNVAFGFIAFLTKISLLIDGLASKHASVGGYLHSHPDWHNYVNDFVNPRAELVTWNFQKPDQK